MVELLTGMWIYLVGAALLGLIIGWAFRGAFLPRPKTVSVSTGSQSATALELTAEQKDALRRAEQADAAIAALEARVKTAQEAAAQAQGEISDLKTALRTAEDKLNSIGESGANSDLSGTVLAGAAGTAVGALAARAMDLASGKTADDPVAVTNDPKLEWRSRYLESRVRYLESLLSDTPLQPKVSPSETTAPPAELAQVKAALEETELRLAEAEKEQEGLKVRLDELTRAAQTSTETGEVSPADFAKLQWQNRYLKARLLHIEEAATPVTQAVQPMTSEATDSSYEIEGLKSEILVLKAEIDRSSGTDTEAEKELARLRWRNRYLEGRLKYLEAASLDAASDADDTTAGVAAALSGMSAPLNPPDPAPVEDTRPAISPSEEVRPLSLDAPRNGQPDDLKQIGGVGPKIEGILNELGIFHFDQVAAWTDEEAAWVDSYLRFQGRVQREKWVEQASALQNGTGAA